MKPIREKYTIIEKHVVLVQYDNEFQDGGELAFERIENCPDETHFNYHIENVEELND